MIRALRVLKGVAALLALVGMVVGVPLFLVKAAGWPLPSHLPSPQAVGDALTRNGVPAEVIVKAVAVVIWLAWAQLVLSVAVEVVALARHRQLGHVRGLGGSRVLAASLVTTAAALLSAFGSLRPAGAVVAARPAPALAVRPSAAAPVAAPGGRTWTVRPRDTFWLIAEATLGVGERWREIERLNRGREVAAGVVLLPGTDLLRAGWTLRLPAVVEPGDLAAHGRGRGSKPPTTALAPAPAPTAAPSAAPTPAPTPVPGTHPAPGPDPTGPASPPAPAPPAPVSMPAATPVAEPVAEIARPPQAAGRLVTSPGDAAIGTAIELVRVRAGDTLSSIALRVYGDPHQWPRIWEANRDRLFGHHRFTDPDVIMAGWVLDVPLTETPPPPARPMGVTVERVSTRGHVHLDRLPDRVNPAAAVPAAAPSVGPLPTAMSTPVAAPQPWVAASASGPAAGGGS